MKMTPKKLLENVYFAALYHRDSNDSRARDFSRDKTMRERDRGLADAYSYIVQLIEYPDTLGVVNYKKVHSMKQKFPKEPKALPITSCCSVLGVNEHIKN
jgi:hypothetical protein